MPMNFERIGPFRYTDLPVELQKNVLEKYFEDYKFCLKEVVSSSVKLLPDRPNHTCSWKDQDIPKFATKLICDSEFNLLSLLLVSRSFQEETIAALVKHGQGSYEVKVVFRHRTLLTPRLWRHLEESIARHNTCLDSAIQTLLVNLPRGRIFLCARRFKNLRRIEILGTFFGYDRSHMGLGSSSGIITSDVERRLVASAARELHTFFINTKNNLNAILEHFTVHWRKGVSLSSKRHPSLPYADRIICMEFTLDSEACLLTAKSVKDAIFGSCPQYIGEEQELTCMERWVQATRDGDDARAKELAALWKMPE